MSDDLKARLRERAADDRKIQANNEAVATALKGQHLLFDQGLRSEPITFATRLYLDYKRCARNDSALAKDWDEAADCIEQLEAKIENAGQAMAETSKNWEARCYAIMAALGMNFGGYSEDVPDVGSWFEITNRRNIARIEALELALTQSRAETAAAYERAAMEADCSENGYIVKAIRALVTPEQSAALDAVIAEKLKENTKGIAEPCPCTLIEQDESCPVGYPSLLCSICQGTGNTTPDKITALACEMLKIASDLGETEDPFAAWEVIASMQEEAQLCEAIKAEARAQGMREASEIADNYVEMRTNQIAIEKEKAAINMDVPQVMRWGAGKVQAEIIRDAILAAIQKKGEPK